MIDTIVQELGGPVTDKPLAAQQQDVKDWLDRFELRLEAGADPNTMLAMAAASRRVLCRLAPALPAARADIRRLTDKIEEVLRTYPELLDETREILWEDAKAFPDEDVLIAALRRLNMLEVELERV